jgi:short-subunit dehydrogenase
VVALGRDQAALLELAGEVELALSVDLSSPRDIALAVQTIEDAVGPPEVLIHNAGQGLRAGWERSGAEATAALMEANLATAQRLSAAVLPGMVERGHGLVICVSSVGGLRGLPQQSAYAASKHALVGWCHSLRRELLPSGVAFCALCPPAVDTPFFERAGFPAEEAARVRRFAISPEEVARASLELAARPRPLLLLTARARLLEAADRLAPGWVDRLWLLRAGR